MEKNIRLSEHQIIRRMFLLAFCLLSTAHCSLALSSPTFYGDEVVVTAARMPQLKSSIPWSVSVVTNQDLKLMGAKYLSDALVSVIGTDVISSGYLGANASVRLRGSSSQQVLILIDGQRANSPLNGGVDLSNYPVDAIDRIEVVRTPLSAVYGSDAVGGAVNIITRKPAQGEKALAVSFGSFNEQKVKLSYNYYDETWATLFDAGLHKDDGPRANSQFSALDYNIKMERPFAGTNLLGLEYGDFLADKRIPGSLTYPSPNASQADRRNVFSVSVSAVPDKNSSYQAKIYRRAEQNHYIDPDYATDSDNKTVITGVEFEKHTGSLVLGADARLDAGDGNAIGGHKETTNLALYVQNTYGILDFGLRGDQHSNFGSILTPRAGIKQPLNQDVAVSLAYSGAFRAPVLNELYGNYPAYYAGGLPYLGNPNLKPEKGYMTEISVEYRQLGRLTAYSGKTSDLITSSWPVNDALTAFSPKNLSSVSRQGVEFESQQRISPLLKGALNYTYQDVVDGSTGDKVVYLPQNKANLNLIIGDDIGGGSLALKYVGPRPYVDYPAPTYAATKATLPEFYLIDLHLFRKVWQAEIYFGVENLLNKSYQLIADYPQPGRKFSFGIKYGI